MSTIVVTGAAGFVGRNLTPKLVARGDTVIAIDRVARPANTPGAVTWIEADLNDPTSYAGAISGVDCVLHLAALTGKARPEAFKRANVEATQALIRASEDAGVKRFVLMSSIAVTFAARAHYPYADSKIEAEARLRASKLGWTIVRPTMILGPGSPIQASLEKLALMPVTPVFGNGRCRIEPVDVQDVADLLAGLAHDDAASGAIVEIGGGDAVSMIELLKRLRQLAGASGSPRFLHVPLGLTRSFLGAVEGPALPVLPFTAGQLATFANDSVAEPSPHSTRHLPSRRKSPAGK